MQLVSAILTSSGSPRARSRLLVRDSIDRHSAAAVVTFASWAGRINAKVLTHLRGRGIAVEILVVYESSYGNTHLIADAIAHGLGAAHTVRVEPVVKATRELVDRSDLVVVGGPTHIHGMSRPATREKAIEAAKQPDSSLLLDADAAGPGLREWFADLGQVRTNGAAFDTRVDASALITGRASKGISKQLRHHGFHEIADPMSFLVTKETQLAAGQEAAARQWGESLAHALLDNADKTGSAGSH